MNFSDVELLKTVFQRLIRNESVENMELPPHLQEVGALAEELQGYHNELNCYASLLSSGNLEASPPSENNYLAAGMKKLQAQMQRLTNQAQSVIKGDYNQQVNFMVEFSSAYNNMINQLRDREADLSAQQEAMRRIFDKIEAIFVIDDSARVLYANQTAVYQFGIHAGKISKTDFVNEVLGLVPDDMERQLYDSQKERWYSITTCKTYWGNSDARLFYCLDITAHKERESNLEKEALTDALTGVNNRRFLDKSMADHWDICMKAGRYLSVLIFDIDHFKDFNDRYGHQQGDECLKVFAGHLKKSVFRPDDVVGRFGGEEFVVVLPFTDKISAVRIADSIRETIEKMEIPVVNSMEHVGITVSCGVASVIPTNMLSLDILLRAADKALYKAKHSGRNKVCSQDLVDIYNSGIVDISPK